MQYMHYVEKLSDSTDDANSKYKFISVSIDIIQMPTYYLRDYWLQHGFTVGYLELVTLPTRQTDVLLHWRSISHLLMPACLLPLWISYDSKTDAAVSNTCV